MPKLDSITISTVDLDRLIRLLEQKKHYGEVLILDDGETYILRDVNGFKIGEIGRSFSNQKTT